MHTITFKKSPLFRCIVLTVLTAFAGLLPEQPSYAQVPIIMPAPGQMIHITPYFEPPQMIGLKVDLKDPFNFNFIMDQGETPMPDDVKKEEFNKIIKYFLVALAMPNKDMWVNLSPYESKRIIPEVFSQTEMGRDLLAQDYILKQFTASLIYPENGLGKKFWNKVYAQAQSRFGTTDIKVNTFNKVWIVADHADVYQKGDTAFLVKSHLKVMLDQDYMAIEKNKERFGPVQAKASMASQTVRDIIIPAIEKEVNEGKNFAAVRQIYNAEIMATWFKKTLRQSLLGQVFVNQSKIGGQRVRDPQEMEKIYQQYLKAYKKGVFNYIKEDATPDGQTIPRKYFSGGMQNLAMSTVVTVRDQSLPEVKSFARSVASKIKRFFVVTAGLAALTSALMAPGSAHAFTVQASSPHYIPPAISTKAAANWEEKNKEDLKIWFAAKHASNTLPTKSVPVPTVSAVKTPITPIAVPAVSTKAAANSRMQSDQNFKIWYAAKHASTALPTKTVPPVINKSVTPAPKIADHLPASTIVSLVKTIAPGISTITAKAPVTVRPSVSVNKETPMTSKPQSTATILPGTQTNAPAPTSRREKLAAIKTKQGAYADKTQATAIAKMLAAPPSAFTLSFKPPVVATNTPAPTMLPVMSDAEASASLLRWPSPETNSLFLEQQYGVPYLSQFGIPDLPPDPIKPPSPKNTSNKFITKKSIGGLLGFVVVVISLTALTKKKRSTLKSTSTSPPPPKPASTNIVAGEKNGAMPHVNGTTVETTQDLQIKVRHRKSHIRNGYRALVNAMPSVSFMALKGTTLPVPTSTPPSTSTSVPPPPKPASTNNVAAEKNGAMPHVNGTTVETTQDQIKVRHRRSRIRNGFRALVNAMPSVSFMALKRTTLPVPTSTPPSTSTSAPPPLIQHGNVQHEQFIIKKNLKRIFGRLAAIRTQPKDILSKFQDEVKILEDYKATLIALLKINISISKLDDQLERTPAEQRNNLLYTQTQQEITLLLAKKETTKKTKWDLENTVLIGENGSFQRVVLSAILDKAQLSPPVGGINLSDENLTINIKVDGAGMPLPAQFQDKAMIHLNGLTSVIRKITPLTAENVPALYELLK